MNWGYCSLNPKLIEIKKKIEEMCGKTKERDISGPYKSGVDLLGNRQVCSQHSVSLCVCVCVCVCVCMCVGEREKEREGIHTEKSAPKQY